MYLFKTLEISDLISIKANLKVLISSLSKDKDKFLETPAISQVVHLHTPHLRKLIVARPNGVVVLKVRAAFCSCHGDRRRSGYFFYLAPPAAICVARICSAALPSRRRRGQMILADQLLRGCRPANTRRRT